MEHWLGVPISSSYDINSKNSFPIPLWYLAPFILAYTVFWLVPICQGFYLSIQSDSLFEKSYFVGLKHYAALFQDGRFWLALKNTFIYTLGTLITILPISLGLAVLLNKIPEKISNIISYMLLIPGLSPPLVLGFLFLLIFNGRYGILNNLLVYPLGFDTLDWIKDPMLIKISLVFQAIWRWSGIITLFLLSGLRAIPKNYYDVSKMEGASGWAGFLHITFPLLKRVLIFSAIVLFLDAFVLFQGAYVLLGSSGGTADAGLLLVSYSYYNAFTLGKFGYSAAISFSLVPFLISLLIIISFTWREKKSP